MPDSTYSTVADLLLGDLPVPPYMDKQKYVNDAADEMDSYIGFVYQTPINMDEAGPVIRPARLLLHRIASHLSTGRLLLAIATAGEDTQLHSYGSYLTRESLQALEQVVNGTAPLSGAIPADGSTTQSTSGPTIANIDQFSMVESFYTTLSQPVPYEAESYWRVPGG